MSQPTYDANEVVAMSNDILATKLEQWAEAREYVSRGRIDMGKKALDTKLLREAARRLRWYELVNKLKKQVPTQ